MYKRSIIASVIALGLSAISANAVVVGGSVTGGDSAASGGVFVNLDPMTGFTVGNDSFNTVDLYAFKEGQNARANMDLSVDIGTGVSSGQMFSSHYVFFDPTGKSTQSGFVDFSAPIYGIATSETTLAATDAFKNNNVTYLMGAARGLEGGDVVSIDPTNPSRLLISWKASSPGDYLRVLTQAGTTNVAPIPLPGGFLLMVGALAGLGAVRQTKRT